jgi:predicted nucleic-acid-binding protein
MKRIGLDTNVVVSFITDRDAAQQARAAEVFSAATAGEHVIVLHQAVILETVYVLHSAYGTPPKTVSAVMKDLLSLPGVIAADAVDWPAIWATWPRSMKDFGDACLTAVAKAGTFDLLATFDAAFSRRARKQGLEAYW